MRLTDLEPVLAPGQGLEDLKTTKSLRAEGVAIQPSKHYSSNLQYDHKHRGLDSSFHSERRL